uniref:Putative DNA recombination protein n=1 Tax=viral metagenome TaxID=1070528 RepID=A0A6H1ZN89_9ZZZZ
MNELIIVAGEKLQLPPARNEGAKRLFSRLERLPQWLPSDVQAARFVMAVATEVNRLPTDTDPNSIVACAFNLAVVGLLPGPQLGHAHMVPFRDKKRNCRVATLVIGYRGFLSLAYGVGFLRDCQPEIILRGEEFERWNDAGGAQVKHTMLIDRELVWGNVVGAYCIWHATTGGHGIEVVGRKELETLKRRGNVWDDNPIAMAKKTAVRRAAKLWKITGRMAQAIYLDELAERDEAQPMLVGQEPDDDPAPSLAEFEATVAVERSPVSPELFDGFRAKLTNAKDKQETWAEIRDDPAFDLLAESQAAELRGLMGT